jgi:hypothetical protein
VNQDHFAGWSDADLGALLRGEADMNPYDRGLLAAPAAAELQRRLCVCDLPRFVSPHCTLHGAHEYHGAPTSAAGGAS